MVLSSCMMMNIGIWFGLMLENVFVKLCVMVIVGLVKLVDEVN